MGHAATYCFQLHQATMPTLPSKEDLVSPLPRYQDVYAHDPADYGDGDISDTFNLNNKVANLQANVDKKHFKAAAFILDMELWQGHI